MKRPSAYFWILALTIVASLSIMFFYFYKTGSNPITILVDDFSRFLNINYVKNYPKNNNGEILTNVVVLDKVDVPVVYINGQVASYEFSTNPQNNKRELLIVFKEGKNVIPVIVNNFVTTKVDERYLIENASQADIDYIKPLLDLSIQGFGRISSNKLIFTSLRNGEDKADCEATFSPPEAEIEKWCKFDQDKKSYNTNQLIGLINKLLKNTNKSEVVDFKPNEFFSSTENISIVLQISFSTPE